MKEKEWRPSAAEMLAALITGRGDQSEATATVQRSHRFPVHLLIQMENLAKHGDVPVSVIINELIVCGLEAVLAELPQDIALKVSKVTKDQMDRPSVTERFDSKEYRTRAKKKARGE